MRTRKVQRLVSGILGAIAAVITISIPFVVYTDMTKCAYPVKFWSLAGEYVFATISTVLFLALTYLSLRYATKGGHLDSAPGRKAGADAFFKGLAVAGTAVVVVSIASQFIFLLVQAFGYRDVLETQRTGLYVGWSPYMWQVTRESPFFLALVLVVFVFSFFWEYRNIGQS